MRNANPLPFVRAPFSDELVTSWLERTAALYGRPWASLAADINAERLSSVGDYKVSRQEVSGIAKIFGLDAGVIAELDLARRFEGYPVTRFICHPDTKLAAPDYCGACFYNDYVAGRDNYFRHAWAMAGVSHCHIHTKLLRSTCIFCGEELSPLMLMVNGRIQVYCQLCSRAISTKPDVWEYKLAFPDESNLALEARILRSAPKHGLRFKPRFRLLADIAFLFSKAYMSAPGDRYKHSLYGWSNSAQHAAMLSTPLRKSWNFDGSQIFPLSSTQSEYRAWLVRAAVAIMRGVKEIYRSDLGSEYEISIQGLFDRLDDAGREELLLRADGWPKYLRDQVRKVVFAQRITECTRIQLRMPWFFCDARLAANRGELPKYLHF